MGNLLLGIWRDVLGKVRKSSEEFGVPLYGKGAASSPRYNGLVNPGTSLGEETPHDLQTVREKTISSRFDDYGGVRRARWFGIGVSR
jgi:hypothetical protein